MALCQCRDRPQACPPQVWGSTYAPLVWYPLVQSLLTEVALRKSTNTLNDLHRLEEIHLISDSIGEQELVVFWISSTRGRFSGMSTQTLILTAREVNAQWLTFQKINDGFEDKKTGRLWIIAGEVIEGPLAGKHLTPIVLGEHFLCAWSVVTPIQVYNRQRSSASPNLEFLPYLIRVSAIIKHHLSNNLLEISWPLPQLGVTYHGANENAMRDQVALCNPFVNPSRHN